MRPNPQLHQIRSNNQLQFFHVNFISKFFCFVFEMFQTAFSKCFKVFHFETFRNAVSLQTVCLESVAAEFVAWALYTALCAYFSFSYSLYA